ncbi:MAG: hypothetical protein V2J14_02995 [Erythrobacter sp.]|nr:hypothetical protein [Erythrobacter sp.]
MKRSVALGALTMLMPGLAACGSSEPEPVVEQIIVREPGEAAPEAQATPEPGQPGE